MPHDEQAPPRSTAERAQETPELWFHRRATYYVEAQILFHLNQLGVMTELARGGARSAAELALLLGLEEGVLTTLLEYVYEIDALLERDAQGRYSLSAQGRRIVDRFSSSSRGNDRRLNLFDVRIGGYGPVWANLGRLLKGARYGQEVRRDGGFADGGVRKLGLKFWPALHTILSELGVRRLLEIGPTSGLLQRAGAEYPQLELFGLDRSPESLRLAAEQAERDGVPGIRWLQGDLFLPALWLPQLAARRDGAEGQEHGSEQGPDQRPGVIFSLHFHEFLAHGAPELVAWLRALRPLLPGWRVVALEQPRLPHDKRPETPEHEWLYAQSNVLIHHLIGNGQILDPQAWHELGRQAGCTETAERPCDYLGYRAFIFKL